MPSFSLGKGTKENNQRVSVDFYTGHLLLEFQHAGPSARCRWRYLDCSQSKEVEAVNKWSRSRHVRNKYLSQSQSNDKNNNKNNTWAYELSLAPILPHRTSLIKSCKNHDIGFGPFFSTSSRRHLNEPTFRPRLPSSLWKNSLKKNPRATMVEALVLLKVICWCWGRNQNKSMAQEDTKESLHKSSILLKRLEIGKKH